MLFLFLGGLIASLLLAAALFWLLIRRLRINWSRSNRTPVLFLLPVVLALLLVLTSAFLVYPRIADLTYMLNENYEILDLVVEAEMVEGQSLRVGEQRVLLPQSKIPAAGTSVRLYLLPHTRHVLKLDLLSTEVSNLP